MKSEKLLALAVMALSPLMMFADSSVDRQIDDAANSSYNLRAVLDGKVKASTKDGVVTLSGSVQDRDQKRLAEDTVSNLPGVLSVVNDVKVESEPKEHSDAWIALKIHSALLVHANVSAMNTKVDVNNGEVMLTGTADNEAQKELTETYVKSIEGVRSVKNDLQVKEQSSDNNANGRTVGEVVDDASITTQVKYALLSHKSTSALKTKVTTRDGNVMISGEAGNDAEKDLVTKLANGVRGVRSVENEMTVRSN
ncbi:MAG TPA: BON domain-containing protein [Candidatus Didemnitutus sp.]|nr:BON domain-containing protein [Candidatus Didemnitutus sp.]